MPHVAFLCPDTAMWSLGPGNELVRTVPIRDCLNCSLTRVDRSCAWDYQDLTARIEAGYDEMFSPSRFNGCDREMYLRERHDFWTDPSEQTYRVRGTAAHSVLEQATDPRIIAESRVYRVLPGALDHLGRRVVVGVKPDAVYPGTELIADFKTWKYLPRGNVVPGQIDPQPVKDAVKRQLSIGAWAWADPLAVQFRGASYTTLAPAPIHITRAQESLRDGSGKGYLRQLVELMDYPVLENWMRSRVLELNAARLGTEPGYCSDGTDGRDDQRWKCGNCPVRRICGIPKELYVKPKPSAKKETTKRAVNRH